MIFRRHSRITFWASLLLGLFGAKASAQMLAEQPSLTLDAAEKMVNACELLAKAKGWKVSVWVLDDAGVPVFMKRMQGASAQSILSAAKKAETSRLLSASTDPTDAKSPAARLTNNPAGQISLGVSNLLPEGGGLPVIVDGKVAGAIGVSGVDSSQSAECARVGVRAVVSK